MYSTISDLRSSSITVALVNSYQSFFQGTTDCDERRRIQNKIVRENRFAHLFAARDRIVILTASSTKIVENRHRMMMIETFMWAISSRRE